MALDPSQFGLIPDSGAPPAAPAAGMSAGDFGLSEAPDLGAETASPRGPTSRASASSPGMIKGIDSSLMHSFTMGADEVVKPAIAATINSILRPFVSNLPGTWGSDYDQAQAEQRDARKAFEQAHPAIATTAGVVGGVGNAAMTAPLFKGVPAAASTGAKTLNYLRNIGAGAAVGGAAGFGAGEGGFGERVNSAVDGAALGGALSGLLPPAMWAGKQAFSLAPAAMKVLSPGARETATGRTLLRDIRPSDIQTSPVGPLDLAQATGNPGLAGKVDYAEGAVGKEALGNLRGQQAQAVRDASGQIAQPSTKANSSASFIENLRAGRDVAGGEESRLWNVPELSAIKVTIAPVQQAVNEAVGSLDPALRDAMTPQLRAIVGRVNSAPNTTMQDLNGIRSDLLNVARRSADGSERAIANDLADAFIDGIGKVPEIAGAPNGIPTGKMLYGYNNGVVSGTPEMSAPIAANPAIGSAYQAARDYTRQMRGLFKFPDTAASLAQRDGQFVVNPSEGAGRFFNFANGTPEGAQNIAQLSDFIGALKQPGAGAISGNLKSAAQSYVMSALQDAAKLGEGQKFAPAQVQQFLARNRGWMKSSGLFDPKQIDLADKLMDYAGMLNRTNAANTQVGSQTAARTETGKTFVDQIMNPWTRRLIELGMIGAGAHSHGGLGGIIGGAAAGGMERAFASAQDAMQTLMVKALSDPQIANDLMMRASPGNARFFSPATKSFLAQWGKSLAAEEAGRTQSPQGTPQR